MLLDKDTRSLQIRLGAAIVTNNVQITAEYEDEIREALKPETIFTQSNGSSDVIILEAPEQATARRVIELHIYNGDVIAQEIIILIIHSSTPQIIQNATLNPGDTLYYNRFHGWSVQYAGNSGRGPINKRYRVVSFSSGSKTVTLDDDILDLDASGGAFTMTFNPAIVTIGGMAKEIEMNKIEGSTNGISISDGTSVIDILSAIDTFNVRAINDGSNPPVLRVS